jgi:hypothetical protein
LTSDADRLARDAAAWTRPRRLAVASFIAGSSVANVAVSFVFRDELVSVVSAQIGPPLRAAGRALGDRELGRDAEYYVYAWLALTVIGSVPAIILALLTGTRARTWAFWVDLGVLAGVLFALPAVLLAMASPPLPQSPTPLVVFALAVGIGDALLLVWMLYGLLTSGPAVPPDPGQAG